MSYRFVILLSVLFIGIEVINATSETKIEQQDMVKQILQKTYNIQYADLADIDHFIQEHHITRQQRFQLLALKQICYRRIKHYNYSVDSLLYYCNKIVPEGELWQEGYEVVFDTYSDLHKDKEALKVAIDMERHIDTLPVKTYASIAEIYERLEKPQKAIDYYWKALQESERLYTLFNFTSSLYAKDIIRISDEQSIPLQNKMFACCDSIINSKNTYSGDNLWSPYWLSNNIYGSKTKEDTLAYLSNQAYFSQIAQIEIAKSVLQQTITDKTKYNWVRKSNPIDLAQHIASVYTEISQSDSALYYYQLADSMAQLISNPQKHIAILINIVNLQIQNGQLAEAQFTLSRVQSILHKNWGITDTNLVEYQKRTLTGDLQNFGGISISTINNYLLISSRLYGTLKDYDRYHQYQSLLHELAGLSDKPLRTYLGYYSNYYMQNTEAYVYYNQKNKLYGNILTETLTDFQNNYLNYLTKTYKSSLGLKIAYSSAEREQILRTYSVVGTNIIIYAAHTHDPHIAELAYNYVLFNKQLLLNTDQQLLTIQSDSNQLWINRRNRLKKQQLHASPWERDSLQKKINEAERRLTALQNDTLTLISLSVPTAQQILTTLPDSTACIEFVRYKDFVDWQFTRHTYYAALLLRANDTLPMFIDLCDESDLNSVLVMSSDSISISYNSNQLYEYLWSKLIPYLSDIHTIYFASDGILHQLAIEASRLPNNQLVSDRFNLIRLTSTKDILSPQYNPQYTSATVFGDIDYGTISNTIASTRTARNMLDPLTYSKQEIQSVSKELQKHRINTTTLLQRQGTEEQVMHISGNPPSILHFSTHGFAYTNDDALELPYYAQSEAYYIDPMERTGLYLSNAAHALSGGEVAEGEEDGILTATEIATLDLHGTDLVVLSACETALGDITSEGVWGLQRAFRLAGARTLVMSLWQVDDQATALLMQYFYEELFGTQAAHMSKKYSATAALNRAQHRLRQIPKYSAHYFWAGFIVIE